jgi:hypothetical protein
MSSSWVPRRPLLVALLALLGSGCQSDAAAICERLASCHLLPTGNGFDEKTCEGQVQSELSDQDRSDCADCVSAHGCSDIVTTCHGPCAPKVTCIDPDRCPDAAAP